jgi:hypothetical protein
MVNIPWINPQHRDSFEDFTTLNFMRLKNRFFFWGGCFLGWGSGNPEESINDKSIEKPCKFSPLASSFLWIYHWPKTTQPLSAFNLRTVFGTEAETCILPLALDLITAFLNLGHHSFLREPCSVWLSQKTVGYLSVKRYRRAETRILPLALENFPDCCCVRSLTKLKPVTFEWEPCGARLSLKSYSSSFCNDPSLIGSFNCATAGT